MSSADSPSARLKKIAVVAQMVSDVSCGGGLSYFVVLAGYWIEGYPYSASGLSVDHTGSPDIRLTMDGFECGAFFAPNMLLDETVLKNGIIQRDFGQGTVNVVKVRVEVKLRDIIAISSYPGGRQTDLVVDEAAFPRQVQFMEEMEEWFRVRTAGGK